MSSMVNNPEMDGILSKLDEIEELEAKIASVKLEIDEMVPVLKKKHPDFVAGLSTKTGYKGNFFSIRSRYSADLKRHVHYICKTQRAFGSWLKKPKKDGSDVSDGSSESGGSD